MKNKKILLSILSIILCFSSFSQTSINVRQADAKFTLSATRSSGFGSEEYKFYVQNNTGEEYKMEIRVTLNLACVGEKSFTLGINKIVYLPPNGKFDAFSDDWVHAFFYDVKRDKNCLLKDGDAVTLFKGMSYTISNVINLTQQKAAAAKKKDEDKLKAEADKKKKEDEAKAKADVEKKKREEEALARTAADAKKKETEAKVAADKKKTDEAAKAKTTESSKTASKSTATTTTSSGSSSSTSKSSTSNASKASVAKEDEANRKAEAKQKAEEERQKEIEAEKERQKAEQALLDKKQADYNQWKTNAQNEKNASDAASFGAFAIVATLLGEWIYNENMGQYDPAFSFKRNQKKVQFGLGIDFGYSMSLFPMLYESKISTVSGGRTVNTNDIQEKNPLIINFDPMIRMGVENNNFGGFAYVGAKIGTSPILDGSQFSFNYGARIYAGAKGIKAYFDYGSGSRSFKKSPSDVEDNGSGESSHSFSKLEYGIKITSHPEDDLKRSHFYLGIISEKLSFEKPNKFLDPISGTLNNSIESSTISGYSFQWNKEHTFKLFMNFYPEFVYTGAVNTGSGPLNSAFKTTTTGTFFELGFVRSVNWW